MSIQGQTERIFSLFNLEHIFQIDNHETHTIYSASAQGRKTTHFTCCVTSIGNQPADPQRELDPKSTQHGFSRPRTTDRTIEMVSIMPVIFKWWPHSADWLYKSSVTLAPDPAVLSGTVYELMPWTCGKVSYVHWLESVSSDTSPSGEISLAESYFALRPHLLPQCNHYISVV